MKAVVKVLVVLAFVGGLVALGSYAGARATAGKLLGNDPPVSDRTISFAFSGVEGLPNKPRAWVFSYATNQLGVRSVEIYISPSGKVIATQPRNLAARLEAYESSREP